MDHPEGAREGEDDSEDVVDLHNDLIVWLQSFEIEYDTSEIDSLFVNRKTGEFFDFADALENVGAYLEAGGGYFKDFTDDVFFGGDESAEG